MEATSPILIEVPGRGITDLSALKLDKEIQLYDEHLRFGWNPTNQDYVIYILMPRGFDAAYHIEGEPAYPVLGFGKQIPTLTEAMSRLRAADTRKRGMDIYNSLLKHNKVLRANQDFVTAAAVGEAAERIEQATRAAGLTEKYGKVAMHIPKSKKR